MRTHFLLTLMVLIFASCASYHGDRFMASEQEKQAQATHDEFVDGRASRFR